jgi:hypothetical protein
MGTLTFSEISQFQVISVNIQYDFHALSQFLGKYDTHLYSRAVRGWNGLYYTHCSPCLWFQGDSCTVQSLHDIHHSHCHNGYSYKVCKTRSQVVGSQTTHSCTCFE